MREADLQQEMENYSAIVNSDHMMSVKSRNPSAAKLKNMDSDINIQSRLEM